MKIETKEKQRNNSKKADTDITTPLSIGASTCTSITVQKVGALIRRPVSRQSSRASNYQATVR
jgi:hypothetical protein